MTGVAIGVIGGVNVDYTIACAKLPQPGETVLGGTLDRTPGGKGANQAAAAAALGARVTMLGCVGRDENGSYLLTALSARGVDVTRVMSTPTPTGVAMIVVDANGENQIVVAPGANGDLVLDPVDAADFDGVLAQLETPPALVATAATSARALFLNAAPAVGVDPDVLAACAVVMVNEAEAQAIDLPRLTAVVVTSGARGAVWLKRGEVIASAAPPRVAVVDTVGAGDAFCAALTLRCLAGDEPADALAYAVTAGALATRAAGAQGSLPTDEEVRAWLQRAS